MAYRRDDNIVLYTDADIPEMFRNIIRRADVTSRLDGQHHARFQLTPFTF